ncbi:MAG: aspartate aminotransferase family protein [Caldilineaceae bacterium SB0662_bin_9]|uniref:Aspartate aminotransferase family protein n=1 Tax=Caldilineaceae bacterium SB0662_bin_9 TaxID=2605258 RepID=A0A6B1DNM7_9CHLR|nr:aspartate aminotransferase family protein [Caldilineaceae bacterium SB0662_bin_9]
MTINADRAANWNHLVRHTFIDFTQTTEFLKQPVIISKADRITYTDVHGKEFLDGLSGVYAVSLGHNHPRLNQAVSSQLERVTLAPPMHGIADVSLQLVAALGAVAPPDMTFVKSFSGGSEANEAAFKFARQYHRLTGNPGKYKILSCYDSYHGATAGAMAASGTGSRKTAFEPQMGGFLKFLPPAYLTQAAGSPEAATNLALHLLERQIEGEDASTIAALIIEPVIHLAGIAVPPAGWLEGILDLCRTHDILLIYDEIITGIGRTGQMFGAQTFDVAPDILTCGKGLSSGVLPVSAMVTRPDLAEAFIGAEADQRHFNHGHTFASNALTSAVGVEVLAIMEEEDVCANSQAQGRLVKETLKEWQTELPIANVRGEGLLVGFDLVSEPGSPNVNQGLGPVLRRKAIDHGLIMRVQPTWGALAPPLVCTEQETWQILECFREAILDAWDAAA